MILKKDYIVLLEEIRSRTNEDIIRIDNISNYVNKLLDKAKIVTIIEDNSLKAFIAYYNNDLLNNRAFLSMLAVSVEAQRKGLGRQLLKTSVKDLKNSGFKIYHLEVLKLNTKAIALYESFDFMVVEERGDFLYMEKEL